MRISDWSSDVAAYDPDTGFSSPTAAPTPQGQGSLGGVGSTHGYGRVNAFEAVRLVAPAEAGGHGGVDAFLRDNRLERGNTERARSGERRGGKEGVSTIRTRWGAVQ